jgi:ornithine cyclodeaminase
VRYLTRDQTASLLDRDELRRVVGQAMVELSAGRVSSPPRIAATREEPFGIMATMPAHVPALGAMATKVVNVFPGNAERGLHTHQALVLLVDDETGEPMALLDGDGITAERTAAGSALSTELLARADASVLAVLGTGVQARSHALAVSRVLELDELRIAGRDRARAERLAEEIQPELAVPVVVVDSFESACLGAHVVCATTDSPEPIVRRRWFGPGTHVTSVGFAASGPEIDDATVVDAYVVVESRSTAFSGYPVGTHELRGPLEAGLISEDHVGAELGELLTAAVPPQVREGLTLYKSAGVAVQDVAAAKVLHDAAVAAGVGTILER